MFPAHLATQLADTANQQSLWELVLGGELLVQLVLLLLVGFSITSWGIILNKWALMRKVRAQNDAFLKIFWDSERLEDAFTVIEQHDLSPVAQVFRAGYRELRRLTDDRAKGGEPSLSADSMNNLQRAMRRARSSQLMSLERYLSFLATTGSASPFIGLFGTVWGIMRAFQKIGATGAATLSTVGGPISEALIATAVGLLAAIPAVMAYNYYVSRIRHIMADTDNFSADFLNIVQRHFVKG